MTVDQWIAQKRIDVIPAQCRVFVSSMDSLREWAQIAIDRGLNRQKIVGWCIAPTVGGGDHLQIVLMRK